MKNRMALHHFGLACEDITKTQEYLSSFLEIVDTSATVYDANQNANLCMLTLADGIKIELISGEVVKNYIKKRNYMYHTCYIVKNIQEAIEQFVEKGGLLVSEPKEAILFGNNKVAFLMTELGLIELLEE